MSKDANTHTDRTGKASATTPLCALRAECAATAAATSKCSSLRGPSKAEGARGRLAAPSMCGTSLAAMGHNAGQLAAGSNGRQGP